MVDANQGFHFDLVPGAPPKWDLRTAAEFARALEDFDIFWLEEPLDRNDFNGLAELRQRTRLRLAGGEAEKAVILTILRENDYPVIDMTDNDTAKLHIRYMVGGRPANLANEVLYRFQFPERPGALLNFLNHMGERWNISLFHYRNHGSAFGRVLCGMQVPDSDRAEFEAFLATLGYSHWRETDNKAYKIFLN